MPKRTVVPERCNETAYWYATNGYRACNQHCEPSKQILMPGFPGPCDYPMDGPGLARLDKVSKRKG